MGRVRWQLVMKREGQPVYSTPTTDDYWMARRWMAGILRAARRSGLRTRLDVLPGGGLASRWRNSWRVENDEAWRLVVVEERR